MLLGRTVRLRALERHDLPQVVAWFNDPEVRANIARSAPLSLAQEERWFDALLKSTTEVALLIETLPGVADGAVRSIGIVGLDRIDSRNRTCVLGIAIGAIHDRGRGFGTDAVAVLVRHAIRDLGLNRVELEVFVDNVIARRCYARVGFVEEGVRRQAMFKDGSFRDNVVMSVLASDWRDAAGTPVVAAAPAARRRTRAAGRRR